MRKKVMFVAAMFVMSLFIMGFKSKAAEVTDDYTIVKNGVDEDIANMEEDGYILVSVDRKEVPSEKVVMWTIKAIDDDELQTGWIYVNGESQEVYAILYDEDNYVIDSSVMNLSEAADLYR